ncbi:HNH endonuclease signature motif containing protein [Sorangium sp. So ce134]
MTAGRIPLRLRKLVLARDAGRCAFCRCAEGLMGVTFEIDHVAPRSAGRTTVAALQMNRPVMIELRRYWAATGLHPPPDRTE